MFPLLNDRKAGGGGTTINITGGTLYDTVAAVEAATIGGSVGSIQTAGYYAAGDGGGAIYKRVGSMPSHALRVQSADGAWWEFGETVINVLQAGAKGDGTTEDVTAFNAARDWYASGASGRVIVPNKPGQSTTTYKVTGGATDGTRYIEYVVAEGVTFTGGTVFTTRRTFEYARGREERIRGVPQANYTLDFYRTITNITGIGSSSIGYGERTDYTNNSTPTSAYDVGTSWICRWDGMAGGTGLVRWDVYHTPNSNTWTGSLVWIEINPVNRGPDMGWAHTCGVQTRWIAGSRFVPESQDFTGQGGTGRHVLVAYTLARSGSNNADGVRTRTYNGYMVEPDAIAPDGMAAYFNGSTSGTTSEHGVAMLSGQNSWKYGVKLNNVTFSTANLAIVVGNSHKIGWADSSNVVRLTIETGTGAPESSVTANPGSIYIRTNGSVYKKASGTGNTGWVELLGSIFLTNSIADPLAGFQVKSDSTSSNSPSIRVQGNRIDGNTGPGFSGRLLLERLSSGAATVTNVALGSVLFGGNHTDNTEANIRYSAAIYGVSRATFADVNTMPIDIVFRAGSGGQAANSNTLVGAEVFRVKYEGQINLNPLAAVPTANIGNGDLFYNSVSHKFQARINGAWQTLATDGVSMVSVSADKTFVLTEAALAFLHPTADTSARTWTIPANASVAYPAGTTLTFYNQDGAGTVSIAITSDVMRQAGTGLTGTRSLAANGVAVATKLNATEWLIAGVGLT